VLCWNGHSAARRRSTERAEVDVLAVLPQQRRRPTSRVQGVEQNPTPTVHVYGLAHAVGSNVQARQRAVVPDEPAYVGRMAATRRGNWPQGPDDMATVTQPGGHHAQRFTVDDGLRDGYEDSSIPQRRQRGEEHLATFVQVAGPCVSIATALL
jgi:hypothetical protein